MASINESKFHQGALSEEMWDEFKWFVKAAHDFVERALDRDLTARSTTYRKNEAERSIQLRLDEEAQGEAAVRAMNAGIEMNSLAGSGDNEADKLLFAAIVTLVSELAPSKPNKDGWHMNADWNCFAFDEFDAAKELKGSAKEISDRWFSNKKTIHP